MNVTSEMYTKLFNELSCIFNELEYLKKRIKRIQIETEEIYMKKEE